MPNVMRLCAQVHPGRGRMEQCFAVSLTRREAEPGNRAGVAQAPGRPRRRGFGDDSVSAPET